MSHFTRHGSYYTPINSDCVEFCPHPGQQQYFFTGHYELLSKEQGKLGQICLSEVIFEPHGASSREGFVVIPEDEYCTATNENQEFYMTRDVDMRSLLSHPFPSFGHDNKSNLDQELTKTSSNDFGVDGQRFKRTNVALKVRDVINVPALLDAKWSHHPIPLFNISKSTSTAPQSTPESGNDLIEVNGKNGPCRERLGDVIGTASLIAAALEDGSVRLYTTKTQSNHDSTDVDAQNVDNKILQPLSAVQISTNGICLYIDWSNRQRYSNIKSIYRDDLPPSDAVCADGEVWERVDDYIKLWEHYDKKFFSLINSTKTTQDIFPTTKGAVTDENMPETSRSSSNYAISSHYCCGLDDDDIAPSTQTAQSTTSPTSPAKSSWQTDPNGLWCIDDDYEENDEHDWEYEPGPLYRSGKSFTDTFFACSLSDGTVGILDIAPVSNNTSNDNFQAFSMGLSHHWQAHQAECWVAACDGFNHNLVYTGADDSLMKLWDLRMVPTVNQQMQYLELGPEGGLGREQEERVYEEKGIVNRSRGNTTCGKCKKSQLSLSLHQTSHYHGVGFDISRCTMDRGLQLGCNGVGCFCNANLHKDWSNSDVNSQSEQKNPKTTNYKYNIESLTKNNKFNTDFTPVDNAYPILTNTQHEAGVIEIKPHPYNPFLLLTGSYDNHLSLYDKRNLKTPIHRVDTGGGAWRVKWHQNPLHSDQFLLVNMYNGVQYGSIKGMGISLAGSHQGEGGDPSNGDDRSILEGQNFFRPLYSTIDGADSKSSSHYPSALHLKGSDVDRKQSSASFTNVYQAMVYRKMSNATKNEVDLNNNDRNNASIDTNDDVPPSPTTNQSMNTIELVSITNDIYGILRSDDQNEVKDNTDVTQITTKNTKNVNFADCSIDLGSDVMGYSQHGPKSIVYGGDWCQVNDISDRTEPSINNIAVTCSFYNKRTDLLNVE